MQPRTLTGPLALLAALTLTGCIKPLHGDKVPAIPPRPSQITDFAQLYSENCAACHGTHGQNGIAIPMNNPEYFAIADDATIRNVIASGEEGVLMPAFAKSAGGMLTEQQVTILASGMRRQWAKPNTLDGQNPPPYQSDKQAVAANGKQVYANYCASCHGADAAHPGNAGSILDGSFLTLINPQSLRTIILAGRPDLGQPDWRNDLPGRPMTGQQITDVIAWLESQRPPDPGQPYPDKGQQP